MLNLAKGMADAGHTVDLVLAHASGPFLSQIPNSVRLVDLKSSRVLFSLKPLIRYIQNELPDALLSSIDYANIIAILARKIARKPVRLVVVEQNTLSQRITQLRFINRHLLPVLVRWLYPQADCVITVSQGVANDLEKFIGIRKDMLRVVNNPVITKELREKSKQEIDHPWFQPGCAPVIIAVGRLHKQKNFPNLITAFTRVRENAQPSLSFLEKEMKEKILNLTVKTFNLSEEVSMPGFVENPYSYMANASVFALSSNWEGLPTVLIEAMFCGVPVVSTDCPSGPREILRTGNLGDLFLLETVMN